ncbi:hypothetical protein DFH08DRAFT_719468, partial [Mycena albidolilacea]
RHQSSFKSRLATNRSWFPVVRDLMQKIGTECIETYEAKLEKNPFVRPESEGEKAAAKVMRYISYVSDHIPGSVGDVNSMKQQMHGKTVCDGSPHFFAMVNPANSHNPTLVGRFNFSSTIYSEKCCLFFRHSSFFTPFQLSFASFWLKINGKQTRFFNENYSTLQS